MAKRGGEKRDYPGKKGKVSLVTARAQISSWNRSSRGRHGLLVRGDAKKPRLAWELKA